MLVVTIGKDKKKIFVKDVNIVNCDNILCIYNIHTIKYKL